MFDIIGKHAKPPGTVGSILISTPNDSDRSVEISMVQCCHCGRHTPYVPGSGRRRGFCMRCARLTCGDPRCDACLPIEQWLENREAGRPDDFYPTQVSVPAAPPMR